MMLKEAFRNRFDVLIGKIFAAGDGCYLLHSNTGALGVINKIKIFFLIFLKK